MYTAGLSPFYAASNFSLWSAYCAGGFSSADGVKKSSFCIADILQAGGDDSLGGSGLMAHLGVGQTRAQLHSSSSSSASPLRPSPLGHPASPYHHHHHHHHHRHGIHLTSLSRTLSSQQGPPGGPPPSSKDLKFGIDRILSTDFDPKAKEAASLRDLSSIVSSNRQSGLPGPGQGPPPAQQHYFSALDPGMSAEPGPAMLSSLTPRAAGQQQFHDSFPGPYAVLTKDTMPQTYKRKRSWSRAVFSNLQRKGLEKRFEIQKYVTKPDRKQLAAMLGLTDAQVKVWFQNRRMKWRHSKEAQAQKDKEKEQPDQAAAREAEEEALRLKDPDESEECESEPCCSESDDFEDAHEDKSDVDAPDAHNKTSVIMSGAAPVSTGDAPHMPDPLLPDAAGSSPLLG